MPTIRRTGTSSIGRASAFAFGANGLITSTGHTAIATVQIFNNGSTFPLTVDSYAFLAGAASSLSLNGPAAPFDIAVGGSVSVDVVFTPSMTEFANTSLNITSDESLPGRAERAGVRPRPERVADARGISAPRVSATCRRPIKSI